MTPLDSFVPGSTFLAKTPWHVSTCQSISVSLSLTLPSPALSGSLPGPPPQPVHVPHSPGKPPGPPSAQTHMTPGGATSPLSAWHRSVVPLLEAWSLEGFPTLSVMQKGAVGRGRPGA